MGSLCEEVIGRPMESTGLVVIASRTFACVRRQLEKWSPSRVSHSTTDADPRTLGSEGLGKRDVIAVLAITCMFPHSQDDGNRLNSGL